MNSCSNCFGEEKFLQITFLGPKTTRLFFPKILQNKKGCVCTQLRVSVMPVTILRTFLQHFLQLLVSSLATVYFQLNLDNCSVVGC